MKKLIFLVILILFLGSCTTTETPVETIEDPMIDTVEETVDLNQHASYISYASGIEITETIMPTNQRLPQKYFTGTYSKIDFLPLTKKLCITANVDDKDYRNATYYLVGRPVGTTYFGESRYQFLVPSGFGSKTACFYNVDLTQPFEILLSKTDKDDLNPSTTIYSVNTLTLSDTKSENRNRVIPETVIDHTSDTYENGQSPYIHFSASYKTTDRCINSAVIVLFDPFDNKSIDSKEITITDDHYEGDILTLSDIRFDNVAPKVEYNIHVFVSGNDGVDSFEDITLGSYSYETKSYDFADNDKSYHSLFATITGFEVIEDEVILYYAVNNDGSMTYFDTKKPIDMIVTIHTGRYPDIDSVTVPLDMTKNQMILPFEQLKNGLYLVIRDQRFQMSFCDFVIPVNIQSIVAYKNRDKSINVVLIDNDNDPALSMKVEIVDANNNIVETISEVKTTYGVHTYPYIGDYGKTEGHEIVITYEVQTPLGILTHVYRGILHLYPYE